MPPLPRSVCVSPTLSSKPAEPAPSLPSWLPDPCPTSLSLWLSCLFVTVPAQGCPLRVALWHSPWVQPQLGPLGWTVGALWERSQVPPLPAQLPAGPVLSDLGSPPLRTLNNNNITTIPVSSFNHMPKLRTL